MEYPPSHPMALLKNTLPLKDGDEMPPSVQFFEAVTNLMRMWEALDAQSRRKECERCAAIGKMFDPPKRKVTVDEVIDFILERESRDIQRLPPATDKDTGVR